MDLHDDVLCVVLPRKRQKHLRLVHLSLLHADSLAAKSLLKSRIGLIGNNLLVLNVSRDLRVFGIYEFKQFLRSSVYDMPLPEEFTKRSELWK